MNEKIDIRKDDMVEAQLQHNYIMKAREYVKAENERVERPLTISVMIFGCQMHSEPEKERVRII
ncbi:MAG: hypothetical protein K2N80_08550 [Lachnospiraceae bacterium]|nr:hypothetical protein [Lachnospiraceae bacterium]